MEMTMETKEVVVVEVDLIVVHVKEAASNHEAAVAAAEEIMAGECPFLQRVLLVFKLQEVKSVKEKI